MKTTARHELVWGLDFGVRAPYQELTPNERTLVDFRINLSPEDPAHLGIQYGLEGIKPNMVYSPQGENNARLKDEERIEAILLELKTHIRVA